VDYNVRWSTLYLDSYNGWTARVTEQATWDTNYYMFVNQTTTAKKLKAATVDRRMKSVVSDSVSYVRTNFPTKTLANDSMNTKDNRVISLLRGDINDTADILRELIEEVDTVSFAHNVDSAKGNLNVVGNIIKDSTTWGTSFKYLSDDDSIVLDTLSYGKLEVYAYNDGVIEESGSVAISKTGAVTLIIGSTNFSITNVDAKLVVYPYNNKTTIINRLGGGRDLLIVKYLKQ
jgi:hypothetical protein